MVFITIHAVSIDSFSVICVGGQINFSQMHFAYEVCVCEHIRITHLPLSTGPTHYFRAEGGGRAGGGKGQLHKDIFLE